MILIHKIIIIFIRIHSIWHIFEIIFEESKFLYELLYVLALEAKP